MEYSNPKPPEGINVSPEHPLQEFLQLTVGAIALCALVGILFAYGAGWLARFVPFDLEVAIADGYSGMLPERSAADSYLQALAGRLSAAQGLPPGMAVTVHVLDEPEANAMATIGGHVFIHRGLIDELASENALAMVLAHEIAHVAARDPIVVLGRGVVIGLALAALTGASGSDLVGNALGQAGLLAILGFSRAQERAADQAALASVARVYGHVAGASAFFEGVLAQADAARAEAVPLFLRTHPYTRERIAELRAAARAAGWPLTGRLTPLPAAL